MYKVVKVLSKAFHTCSTPCPPVPKRQPSDLSIPKILIISQILVVQWRILVSILISDMSVVMQLMQLRGRWRWAQRQKNLCESKLCWSNQKHSLHLSVEAILAIASPVFSRTVTPTWSAEQSIRLLYNYGYVSLVVAYEKDGSVTRSFVRSVKQADDHFGKRILELGQALQGWEPEV